LYRISWFVHRTDRASTPFAIYHRGVGARTIRKQDDSVRRRQVRQENLTLWKIIGALAIPMLLAFVLVAMDMRSDLDELKSSGQMDDQGAVPIGWSELEGRHEPSAAHEPASWEVQRKVRMIGYMMDGYRPSRDGVKISMFVLLPEAGQFLHPAHRIPSQMVEVWPTHPTIFQYRELVWATGILNQTIVNAADGRAAYAMSDADVQPASERDIGKWFHP
jgi:hypothetical protein